MDRRAAQVTAATGLLYPVLTVVGFVAFPKPPGDDFSAAHDPAWLAQHTTAVIAQTYVRTVAAVGFIALSVALAAAARRMSRQTPLVGLIPAGGVTCGALLVAAQATMLAAALGSRDHLAATVIRPLDDLNAALLGLSSLPAVLLFAGAGALLARSVPTPRWLALLTLAGVPLALLDAASYRGGPFDGVGLLGLAFFLVWSLCMSVHLARSADELGIDEPRGEQPVLEASRGGNRG